ncbi:zinc transporter ZntB [Sphingomonas jatrophae]|uniref:Zinc transporter n=1 Tax=Sphingomonas jatrophae TaxID=1166337 RepID=A0A1I6LPJ9_9SPHN|nr:zinc transporter ZntB [Sphingomonas jatrophae]SFS05182.1 zinc transporter [Sphingomonas jatrophae]
MNRWALRLTTDGKVDSVDAEAACRLNGEAPFVWIHLDGRAAETRAWLEQHGRLPTGVLPALLAVETRPRTEPLGDGALINLRGLGGTPDDDPDPLVSIRIWAEAGRVISVSFRSLAALPETKGKMEAGQIRDPGDLVTAIARLITEALDPEIAALGDVLDECEVDLDPSRAFAMRRRIAEVRSDAIGYRRFVVPERGALERLATLDVGWLDDDDRFHLREAADRFARMGEELEAVRERAALMHEQLTDLRAEQLETRTLVLSIVALVFLPLTFLTGLLGMNVDGIPFAHEPWAFSGVVGLCAVIAGGIGIFFWRARWSGS